ncbi:hypothetical protein [Salinibacterium sp. ZJ450]|uniref:hypothetical protein n=1 Tax=Salinibacterium sp. ZJ450 TaxID=2708338 RepID=UPI00142096AB|nr:hypothetical protein [Salinibacterium sp. ZJ450]
MRARIVAALSGVLGVLLTAGALVAGPAAHAPNRASVKAIDSANTIEDPAWFQAAYDAGFRLYVMHATSWGTCEPWHRTQLQLKMALNAGLMIAVYTRDPRCWEGGIVAAGPYRSQLQFFAIDVEPGGAQVTREMIDGVKRMGVRPVIYSGSGMWPEEMQYSIAFTDVPLWDAASGPIDYDTWEADFESPKPDRFGGWNTPLTMRIGVQQAFEHELNGIYVDLNSFDATFLR